MLRREDRKSNYDRNGQELDRLSTIAAATNCMAQYEPFEDCARRETTGSKNPLSLFGSAWVLGSEKGQGVKGWGVGGEEEGGGRLERRREGGLLI